MHGYEILYISPSICPPIRKLLRSELPTIVQCCILSCYWVKKVSVCNLHTRLYVKAKQARNTGALIKSNFM